MATVRAAAGIAIAILVSSAVWATPGFRLRWLVTATVATAAIIIGGTVFGWPLYPLSDAVTLAFGLFGGVLLGRRYPTSLRAFFILLAVLSVMDVAQNFAFSGPPPPVSVPSAGAPDPHFIWLNFRIPLPSGHLNIGFADLVLIAAMTEHLRRHQAPFAVSLLPGVLGLVLAETLFNLHPPTGTLDTALLQSLVPYLTVGWLVSIAVLRPLRVRPDPNLN